MSEIKVAAGLIAMPAVYHTAVARNQLYFFAFVSAPSLSFGAAELPGPTGSGPEQV